MEKTITLIGRIRLSIMWMTDGSNKFIHFLSGSLHLVLPDSNSYKTLNSIIRDVIAVNLEILALELL